MQIARDLEEASAHFASQLQESSGDEWTHLARTSHASLSQLQQLTTELLQHQRDCWSDALEEYEALGMRASSCRAAASEARRQVQRHEEAFAQAAERFAGVAGQLVAWTRALAPRLLLLAEHRGELREAVALRRRLPSLEREHLAAEDELDMAQTELRRRRRHAQASRAHPALGSPAIDAAAGAILERQYELRVARAEERGQALAQQLREAEQRLEELEAALPLALLPEEDGAGSAGAQHQAHLPQQLSPEERLALKLATLEQFHEDIACQVSQVQAERDQVLKQVAERKEQEATRLQVELDFMCPIMHEKMNEPVLAADGHTYERQAIEKWLQLHNTSPMTGAPLAHRYLTENFALRHVIASYDARAKVEREEDRGAPGVPSSAAHEGEAQDSEESEEEDSYGQAPSERQAAQEELEGA